MDRAPLTRRRHVDHGLLAAALLGWKRAALVMLTVIALVAVGLPVLAGGRGGKGLPPVFV